MHAHLILVLDNGPEVLAATTRGAACRSTSTSDISLIGNSDPDTPSKKPINARSRMSNLVLLSLRSFPSSLLVQHDENPFILLPAVDFHTRAGKFGTELIDTAERDACFGAGAVKGGDGWMMAYLFRQECHASFLRG